MIVGGKFVWLHFPKCAGHAVEQALKSVLRRDRAAAFDAPDREGWHDSPRDRRRREADPQLSDRTVICGFRRLPFWMLSRAHYEASRPPYQCVTRAMFCRGEYFHQNGQVGKADDHALYYGEADVERWIRTEHLPEDFERSFGDILGSRLTRAAVRKLRRIVNGTRLNYIRSLDFHFTAGELEALYAANPAWAARERELYGDILRLSDRRLQPTYFLDRRLRFVAASGVALDTWGMSAEEVIGKHLLEVFPRASGSESYAAHLRALRTMRSVRLDTISPTFDEPVRLDLQPTRAGLQVSFRRSA
ncbi:hypothetical protein [Phenylobacterium sp.]|uniref:PAS domain-containing protein n=1 Tax=Phenylobacterium sp. TaxID=1871053 RepID=UPI002F3F2AD9